MLAMVVVAGITERIVAAFSTAVSADEHPAVRAHCDDRFTAADGVSWRTVFELDLAHRAHRSGMIARATSKTGRNRRS